MRESLSNIGTVCSDHAPKPNPELHEIPIKQFVGKHVKVGFLIDHPKFEKEHMWVLVKETDKKLNRLIGELANDPVYIKDHACGDEVKLSHDEIEAILPEEW